MSAPGLVARLTAAVEAIENGDYELAISILVDLLRDWGGA